MIASKIASTPPVVSVSSPILSLPLNLRLGSDLRAHQYRPGAPPSAGLRWQSHVSQYVTRSEANFRLPTAALGEEVRRE